MKLQHIAIENYKGLSNASSKLDDFSCVIGENNAGKSTLLQSVLLLINGTKLSSHEYFDPKQEILITGSFSGLTGDVLERIGEENKKKIEKYVIDTSITLARRYAIDGTSKLRIVAKIPSELKYRDEKIEEAFKGKKGKELGETLLAFYPEVSTIDERNAVTTQKAAKELIEKYIGGMPADKLVLADIALPTGIDNSIRGILPEPVYIPAVKDFSDDLKTKESATFGKLLHILLEVIEGDLSDAVETFEALRKKLNRITGEDGQVSDERMERVKAIEATIQKNLQETFRDVSIEINIPPPEVKSILSSATIVADDGMRGPVENKGDGFKRAITFSILRTYVQLSQQADWKKDDDKQKATKDKFLFLFEEPELYLHPQAQNVLFEALSLISKTQQVLVTTHSPLFFSPTITKTFIKIYKQRLPDQMKPRSVCLTIDLNDMPTKDQFQIISFETGSHAFFSRRVILVEGDSELIALPHIAKMLNSQWDLKAHSISLVKINGKGSFKRYRDFFSKFNTSILLVSDLDVLLDGFDKTDPSEEMKALRTTLLADVDKIIADENLLPAPSPKLLKEELQRERVKTLHSSLVAARAKGDVAKQCSILDEIFVFEKTVPRLEVLSDVSRANIVSKKRNLLAALRTKGIFVLEKGAIEEYYPDAVTGADKPSMAQSFCNLVNSREEVLALCNVLDIEGIQTPELEVIMKQVFAA